MNNYQAAQQIGIDAHILSRITGTVFVEKSGPNGGKANIGLNLKFTKRGEEVPGYTMKTESGWYYSYKCVKTVGSYINRWVGLACMYSYFVLFFNIFISFPVIFFLNVS